MIAPAPRLGPPLAPGPATPVHITPADFHAAAQRFVNAQNDLERIRDDLSHALSAATGAAGGCDGANQFQVSWAPAVHSVVNDGFDRAADLLGAIGQGIDVSARNHWTADADSAGQAGEPPPWSPVAPRPLAACIGAPVLTGDPPFWMPGFLASYIPTADTGRLDAAAGACRAAAGQVGDLVSSLHSSLQGLLGNNTSDDLTGLEEFWQQAVGPRSILTGLPQALNDLAQSLDDFISWNDDTRESIREKIESVLNGLGAVLGGALVIGSVLSDGTLDVIIAGIVEALTALGVDVEGALVAPIAEVAVPATARLLIAGGVGAITVAKGVQPAIQSYMSSTPTPNVEGVDATQIANEIETQSADPNLGRLRPAERETLARAQEEYPELGLKASAEERDGEYIDSQGRTYDQMGDPNTSRFWDRPGAPQKFYQAIQDHLTKSMDFTVIDLTGFSEQSTADIQQYVDSLPPAQQARILRIGF